MQDHNFRGIQEYVHSTLKCVRTARNDDVFTNLAGEIAERSEGVFLWARLAMNDLIEGHVTGDTQEELLERLKRVPRDLHEVYSSIFSRLPAALKDEANTLLLLVCGAKRMLALQELYIAVKIAREEDLHDDDDNQHVGLPLELLKAFRRRVLARTGGLLEIADRNSDLVWDHEKEKWLCYWEVKLIHETVRPFIENNQGAIFRPPLLGNIAAPRSLWLQVCLTAIREAIPAVKVPDYKILEDGVHVGPKKLWAGLSDIMKQQFTLADYASLFLFDHARDLEMLDGVPSYESLKSVMQHDLYIWHARTAWTATADGRVNSDCVWCNGIIQFATNPRKISSSNGFSLIWAAVHGLAKYCEIAFAKEEELDTLDERLLMYAMNIYKSSTKIHDSHLKASLSTISLLIEHNVRVGSSHIIRALMTAPPQVLNLLLRDRSPGKLRFANFHGENVGPFWLLMCQKYDASYFRRTVDYLIRRGERLNVNCEPAGTALHAPLWSMSPKALWRYEILLKKGADPNISGPAGTPIRLAWTRVLSGRVPTSVLSDYQRLMKLLLDYGALIDWVDEDGVAPTEKQIRAYCNLSGTKRLEFSGMKSHHQ
jgi:hypothetical protein